MPIVEMLSPRLPQMPMAFPKDLVEKLLAFHGYPFVWWAGQLFRYLLRPNKQLADYINEKRKVIGFKRPIVRYQIFICGKLLLSCCVVVHMSDERTK